MNIKEFSLYFNHNFLIKNPVLSRNILIRENCFNPFLGFKALTSDKEIDIEEINDEYFTTLTFLRENLLNKNTENIIKAIGFLCNRFFYYGINIKDFLLFKKQFYNCNWYRTIDNKEFPQDIICLPDKLLKKNKYEEFLKEGQKSKGLIIKSFSGREKIKTEKIDSLKFPNPFSKIVRGDIEFPTEVFDNAFECIEDVDFNVEFQKLNKTSLYVKNCDYCRKEFTTKYNNQKYCNSDHKVKAYRLAKNLMEYKKSKCCNDVTTM